MKWFLGLIIAWLPLFLFIFLGLILNELGLSSSPSSGGKVLQDIAKVFWILAITLGVGLVFVFQYGERPGGFMDIWLDKKLKSWSNKLGGLIDKFPSRLHKRSIIPKVNISLNKMFSNKNITKLLLIIALLLCLLKMPYWYYQLFSIFGTIGFVYLAYLDYNSKLKFTPQIFVAIAIIINPVIKISFDRDTWKIVDIILSVILIVSFFENIIIQKINKLSK